VKQVKVAAFTTLEYTSRNTLRMWLVIYSLSSIRYWGLPFVFTSYEEVKE